MRRARPALSELALLAGAVELLERLEVAGWKIASGEINHFALLDAVAATGRPVMLSTGMSPLAEVDAAVERVRSHGAPLAVLQCTSLYPCPPELVGLNLIPEFRARYGCAVGLSDHSATIYPGLAAAALGIEVLEVHITLSREMFGPDVVASVTSCGTAPARRWRALHRDHARPPGRQDAPPEAATALRAIFMKSVVAARDLPAGAALGTDDLAAKKPGSGIPARELPSLIGRRLRRAVARDALLSKDDLE